MARHHFLVFMLLLAGCGQQEADTAPGPVTAPDGESQAVPAAAHEEGPVMPVEMPGEIDNTMSEAHWPLPPTRLAVRIPDTVRLDTPAEISGESDGGAWRMAVGSENFGRDFADKVAQVRKAAENLPSSQTANIQTLKIGGRDALFFTYRSRHCGFEGVPACNVMWLGVDTGARRMPRIEAYFADGWKGREAVLDILSTLHVMEERQTGFEDAPFRFEPYRLEDPAALAPFRLHTYGRQPDVLGQRYVFGASLPKEATRMDDHYLLVERPDPAQVGGLMDGFSCADVAEAGDDCRADETQGAAGTLYGVTWTGPDGAETHRIVRVVEGESALQVTGLCRGETRQECLAAVDRVAAGLRLR